MVVDDPLNKIRAGGSDREKKMVVDDGVWANTESRKRVVSSRDSKHCHRLPGGVANFAATLILFIYQATDKNNDRLHRGLMRSFRRTLNNLQLEEIHLTEKALHLEQPSAESNSGTDRPRICFSTMNGGSFQPFVALPVVRLLRPLPSPAEC